MGKASPQLLEQWHPAQDAPYLIAKTGSPLQEGLTRIFVHYEPTCLWGDLPGCR